MMAMKIEGSVRANLIAALTSARRWRGRPVHKDTLEHWRRLLDYGRSVDSRSYGEPIADLVAALEVELSHTKVA